MMRGESGAAPITYVHTAPFDTKFAAELKGCDPQDYMDRKAARRLDPFSQYAVAVAEQAVTDAGIDYENLSTDERDRIAVIFGSGIGGMQVFHEQTANYIKNGARRLAPFFIPMLIPDIATGHNSIRYRFRAPNDRWVAARAGWEH